MNKTTLTNLKKYIERNASKFIRQPSHALGEIYKYNEIEIGWYQGTDKIIYLIEICGQDIGDKIPQQFIEELSDTIEQRKAKVEREKQIQSYKNFIKKINKGK